MGFEAPKEEIVDQEVVGGDFKAEAQETSDDSIAAQEEALVDSLTEETDVSGDEKEEKEGVMQGLANKKTVKGVLAAAALAGTIAATAGEASGGMRGRMDNMFDELDGKTEVMENTPSRQRGGFEARESTRKDPFRALEQIGELGEDYKEAGTDVERDHIAGRIAEELILGGRHPQVKENTAYLFTADLQGTPIEVSYIILDGVARGSLKDNSGTFLQKTHTFQFMVK